ncbi:MAG TPA: hypothetical protein VEL49_03060 [Ktedonobacteraceae bacterium]|nr:hypothetical protein [Ktedonobacteraceae bacterium]
MKQRVVFREQALTKSPSSSYHSSPKQVRFQERAFTMGNVVGVNAYHLNWAELKQRLGKSGYQAHETAHFLFHNVRKGCRGLAWYWNLEA